MDLENIAKCAKSAFLKTMNTPDELRNSVLLKLADLLEENKESIFEANNKDLEEAKALLDSNEINLATYNRLKLDNSKLADMIKA